MNEYAIACADEILKAAALMRGWGSEALGPIWYRAHQFPEFDSAEAAHMAGMSPAVAIAVGDWLRVRGEDLKETGDLSRCHEPNSVGDALFIARAYLAGEA